MKKVFEASEEKLEEGEKIVGKIVDLKGVERKSRERRKKVSEEWGEKVRKRGS